MKIQLLSDLHISTLSGEITVNDKADILVLNGDIFSRPSMLSTYFSHIRKHSDIPILYVLGNHEYYGNRFPRDIDLYRKEIEAFRDIYILEKEIFTFQGVNFFGTTMWSNLDDPISAYVVMRGLNDYRYIRDNKGKVISPQILNEEHKKALTWLDTELNKHKGETNVVVTHHAPLWDCRARDLDYTSDSQYITAGFCSTLDTFISQHDIKVWCYGHVHRNYHKRIGNTRVISNSRGFRHEQDVCKYNSDLLIEV